MKKQDISIENKKEFGDFISINSKKPGNGFYISNILLKQCIENKGVLYLDKAYEEIIKFCPELTKKTFDRFILRFTINTKEFIKRKRTTCPLFYRENDNKFLLIPRESSKGEYACKLKYELLYVKELSQYEINQKMDYLIEEINKVPLLEKTCPKYLNIMRSNYKKDNNALIDFKVFSTRINHISDLIYYKNVTIKTNKGNVLLDYENIYVQEEIKTIERETGKKVTVNEMYGGRQGFVYIVNNKYIPGLVKIGRTHRKDINLRMKELSNTNVPGTYELIQKILTNDAVYLEKLLHTFYKHKNVSKEFFRVNEEDIVDIIRTSHIYK